MVRMVKWFVRFFFNTLYVFTVSQQCPVVISVLLGKAGIGPQSVGTPNSRQTICQREKIELSRQDSNIGFQVMLKIGQKWIELRIIKLFP